MEKNVDKIQKQQNRLIWILSVLIVGFVALGFFNMMDKEETSIERKEAKYELTQTDIFAQKDFIGEEVSVKGVLIGDTFDKVIEILGYPDGQTEFPPNIKNIEYGKKFDLDQTGLIIHFRDGIVERITVKPPFNPLLMGKTQINYTKAQVYNMFGVPDDTKFLSISPGSALLYRSLIYNEYGMEISVRKNIMNGFSFVRKKETLTE